MNVNTHSRSSVQTVPSCTYKTNKVDLRTTTTSKWVDYLPPDACTKRDIRYHTRTSSIAYCLKWYKYSIYKFVSFMSHSNLFIFSHTPALSTICRPLSSYVCSITPETAKVGSSYSHMRGPGVGCWFSDRSNCSHWSFEAAVLRNNPNIYTDQLEPIVIYYSITLLVVIQLCIPLQLLSYNV